MVWEVWCLEDQEKKSRIRKTPNPLTDEDGSTDTKRKPFFWDICFTQLILERIFFGSSGRTRTSHEKV